MRRLSEATRVRTGRIRSDGPAIALIAVGAVIIRGIVRWSGFPFVGDWVPVGTSYANQSYSPWNYLLHNGTFNPNLRLVWLFEPLGHLAGQVGSWSFSLANSTFLAIVAILPIVTAFWTLRPIVSQRLLLVILTLFYALNPWITAQDASGHVGIVLGYALLIIVVFPRPGPELMKAVRAGLLLAVIFDLDPHMGVIAGACVVTTVVLRRLSIGFNTATKNQIVGLKEFAIAMFVTLLCSLYWLMPDLAAAQHLAYVPVAGKEPTSTLSSLAQFDDLLHLMGLRSFWWAPFSNGFYGSGIFRSLLVIGLICGPVGLILRALLSTHDRGKWELPALWIMVPVAMTQCAHLFVTTYARIVSLPGGNLFRDPNEALPLMILGLCILAIDAQPVVLSRLGQTLLGVTVVASLVPWATGNLDGYLEPLASVGTQEQTVSWLNDHAGSGSSTLWLPSDSYLTTDWSSKLITDPVSYWTTVTVINPLEDPAYDFSPATTLATDDLESLLRNARSLGELGHALAAAGVRYVVVRLDSNPHSVVEQYHWSLLHIYGVHLVQKFGKEDIFEMPGPIRAFGTVTHGMTLYGGTWTDMEQALGIDPKDHRTFVNIGNLETDRIVYLSPLTTLVTDDIQASAIAIGLTTVMPLSSTRQTIVVDNELMHLYQDGQKIVVHSNGFFAMHLLGLNDGTSEECNGRKITQLAVYQQPDVGSARWIGFNCRGSAEIRFHGSVWVGRVQSSTAKNYAERLATVESLIRHGGSAYMIPFDQFSSVTNEFAMLSDSQNPLVLPPGRYQVHIACNETCPPTRIRLLSAAKGLHPVSPELKNGAFLSTRNTPPVTAFRNEYRLLITGAGATSFEELYLEKVPQGSNKVDGAVNRHSSQSLSFHSSTPTSVISLVGSPAPWELTGAAKQSYGPLIANMYGNALGVSGQSATISLGYLTEVEIVGMVLSGATLVLCVMFLVLKAPFDRKRRDRHRELKNGHP